MAIHGSCGSSRAGRLTLLVGVAVALAAAACTRSSAVAPSPSPSATASPTPSGLDSGTGDDRPDAPLATLAFLRGGDIWVVEGTAAPRPLGLTDVGAFSWAGSDWIDLTTVDGRHQLAALDGTIRDLTFPAGGDWTDDGERYVVILGQRVVVFDRDGRRSSSRTIEATGCPAAPEGQDRLTFGRPAFTTDGANALVGMACWTLAGAYSLSGSIFRVPVLTGRAIPLAPVDLRSLAAPVPSPDGTRFAQPELGGLALCPLERSVLVADVDGSRQVWVTPKDVRKVIDRHPERSVLGGAFGVAWAPDGATLALAEDVSFCTTSSPPEPAIAGLFEVAADGSVDRLLVDGHFRDPAWSPDGVSIAYVAGDAFPGEAGRLRVLDLASGTTRRLGIGAQPSWRPPAVEP